MIPSPPRPTRPPKVSPSAWWYSVVAVLYLAAAVAPVVMLVRGWEEANSVDLNLGGAGETQILAIDRAGGYTIYFTGRTVLEGDADKERLAEELDIRIRPLDGGPDLPLGVYEGFRPIDDVDPTGEPVQLVPLRTVRFPAEGDYEMEIRPSALIDPRYSAIIVAESPGRKLAEAATRAVVVSLILLFLATLSTVILFVTRKRAKRAAGWPPARGGPSPGPGPGPWGAPVGPPAAGPWAPGPVSPWAAPGPRPPG